MLLLLTTQCGQWRAQDVVVVVVVARKMQEQKQEQEGRREERAPHTAAGPERHGWQAGGGGSAGRLARSARASPPSSTSNDPLVRITTMPPALTVRLYTTCDHVHRGSRTLAYTLAAAMAASDAKPFWKRNSMMPCFISDSTPLEQSTGCSSRTWATR